MRRQLIGLSLAVTAFAGSAQAYNNREHERLPDQALQIANVVRRGELLTKKVSALTGQSVGSLTARPASVPVSEQARWNQFIQEVSQFPALMAEIRTGLPDTRVPQSRCAAYPLPDNAPPTAHIAQCKARDLGFAVKRHWASNTSDCFARGNYFPGDADSAEIFNSLPTDYTGALLGYYAQSVDDEVNDVSWWFSDLNSGFLGAAESLLADVSEFGLGFMLAPFACFWSFFSGDNCADKARDWAHQADPVARADQFAKDLEKTLNFPRADGEFAGISTTGVWHFINVEVGAGRGDFNQIAGLHYTQGGWRGGTNIAGVGRIDSTDFTIITLGDLLGYTLDPDKATGVTRYQQSPDGPINRNRDDWLHNIGHIEFEPLDNLALYGWRQFQFTHDAKGLGWVLHALGDAVAPHHGIAATGWGHRPFEDFAGVAWSEMFSEGKPEHFFRLNNILARAYYWWKYIDDSQVSTPHDIPVRELVTAVAGATRNVSDYAIKNGISLHYLGLSDEHSKESYVRSNYGSTADQTRALLEDGTGVTLAFLTKAARIVPHDLSPDPCGCSDGSALQHARCVACSASGTVEAGGRCVTTCPADLPLLDPNGHCVAACPAGSCSGIACGADEFLEGVQCVADCSTTNRFVVGNQCRPSCPAGYNEVPSLQAGGPIFCERSFCNVVAGSGDTEQACCPDNLKFLLGSACVASCPATATFFVRATNQPSNCLSGCPSQAQYFVPGTGPRECTTACPTGTLFGVPTATGRSCQTACTASAPLHRPESGTTVDCFATCPTDMPVHGADNVCMTACPGATPFLDPNSQCFAACPAGTPFHNASNQCLSACPPGTLFHLANGLCVASCPFGVISEGGECAPQPH